MQGFIISVKGSEFTVQGSNLGFRVQGLGIGDWDLNFWAKSLGLKVYELRSRA